MREKAIPLPGRLLEKMAETKQNPRYHAEGSVLAHTELVVQKFQELKDGFSLTASEERILYWAAVMHDIGKTETTRYEDGRWRSPGHEKAGLSMARNLILENQALSPAERVKVLDLVRWHGFPLRWVKHNGDMGELKQLGTRTDLRLLGIFSVFDFQGRVCEEKEKTMGMIHHFQQESVPKAEYELGRFEDLQSTFGKWNLRHKNAAWNALKMGNLSLVERLMDAQAYQDYQTFGKKVYLTVGPALSGKSHYISEQMEGIFHVKLAEFDIDEELLDHDYYLGRKMVEFKHSLVIFLNRHRHVVLEGRNLNPKLRKSISEVVRDLDVELEYLVFESTLEELHERNAAMEHPHSRELIESEYKQFGLVHPWEAHHIQLLRS